MLFRHVPDPPGELTRRVGLAALEACRRTAGVRAGLKWPNDLVADGAKLAGILAERVPSGPVVVGLGLNVGWAPPGAARLGDGIEPLDVLAVMLAAYDELPGDVFERYRSRLVTLGQDVRVELPAGHIEGRAVDVERDGRLVVLDRAGARHSPGHRRRGSSPPGGMTRSARDPQLAWPPVSRSRLRRPPGAIALGLAVLVGVVGSAGVLVAARDRSDDVERVPNVAEVLEEPSNDAPAENFLLVGSDTRENIDPNDPNAAVYGDSGEVVGRRSDTIMVLRRERNGGALLLSLPRDLYLPIAGRGGEMDRINSAYNDGAEVLAQTITEGLGIPINHYVEVDFVGFQRLVDAIGGVEVCVDYATQDLNSGLHLNPGCQTLDGAQGLAYARSRHYEEFRDGDWQEDPRADLGRIERQQNFIRLAVAKLLQQVQADPFSLNALLEAATEAVLIDESTDPLQAAGALKAAAEEGGLQTYVLPVEGVEIDDKSVVELADGAEAILDIFRGVAPPPAATTATTVPG